METDTVDTKALWIPVMLHDIEAIQPAGADCQACESVHGNPMPCLYGSCPERETEES